MMATMTLVNNKRSLHPKLPFKCFKLLSRQQSFLLIIIMLLLMQMTEIYTLNSGKNISMMITTTSASFSDKKKPLTKKEVIMSALNRNEDYLDEDSEEIYDDKIHLNYSGKWNVLSPLCVSMPTHMKNYYYIFSCANSKWNDSGKSVWIYMW